MKISGFLIFLLIVIINYSSAQENTDKTSILFYNVENLFDTWDDPQTEDDEFTPEGVRHWTSKRLGSKLGNISKVILSASGWNPPEIVALCEIENQQVLEKLIGDTPLKSLSYRIIHKESPDHRGIDVALLYNSNKFYPIDYQNLPLRNKNDVLLKTREILYVSGILNERDTIHVFVNHWPSRYSGVLETKSQRNLAASILRQKVDELLESKSSPNIIILGDFNDQPQDKSLSEVLNARKVDPINENSELYNLSYDWLALEHGTLKYQAMWSVFDQIIVSGVLLNGASGLLAKQSAANIINHSFLFEKDEKYGGSKPNRTYYGYTYQGGFSDHLPVLLRLEHVN